MSPNAIAGVLIRKENLDRATGRTPCEDGGGDQYDTSTSQGTPRLLGERHGTDSPSEHAHGTNPVDTLILDF